MGLPIRIRNVTSKTAIIELNAGHFVVCKYQNNISVYLNDAKLKKWYPVNWYKRLVYMFKIRLTGYNWL
ncbi:hypothetical protein [Aquimarina sediminis]|uniref:hypothetical protein n=1 Tax=Aquimarina sediminis TaxID=2070536 RepID=UPI000FFF0E85|nr:hypothetical protein [Aquimarina sediminis]